MRQFLEVPREVRQRIRRSFTEASESAMKKRPMFSFIVADPHNSKRLFAVKWNPDSNDYQFSFARY